METTFEKLNDNEMINVVGGDRILKMIDENGNVLYIIIEEEEAETEEP
jgi:bacteriocin-like protein